MNNSYKDHYEKYIETYKNLSYCNGGKPVWIPTDNHDGWYISSLVKDENSEAWNRGYPNKSRPSILPDDLDSDVERTAYTTISYAKDEYYKNSYYKETEDGIEWMDGNSERLPDYGEICAWSLFVDIDIGKDYKVRPLPEEHKKIVKNRLKLWIDAFARMIGGSKENVFVLDSGGGMYVFTPPAGLSPVYERYEKEELNLIFNEVAKRMREITGELNDLICDQDQGPKELFSADKVQNKNRQFKTIGSIHKDLDTVVYPINPENIEINHIPVDEITEDNITESQKWANEFTDSDHKSYVENIIEYLFQGDFTQKDDIDIDYVEGNNWEDILDGWVERKLESVQKWENRKKERKNISEKKLKTEVTQDKDVARESIRRVNNQRLKQYIVDYLGESLVYEKTNEEMDFFPFWRGDSTESGRSAFYDYYEGQARFTDKSDGNSRDIVYWVALEMTYDDENYPNKELIKGPGDDLSPKEYSIVLDELRSRGEDIPILVPDVNNEEDELSDWRIIQLGKELGIVNDEDIISDNKIKPQVWNKVLDRLEDEDITHNREKHTPLKQSDINASVKHKNEFGKDKAENMILRKSPGVYSEHFETQEEYDKFIEQLPTYVVPFKYDGEILGGNPEGIVAGVFIDQDDESLKMSRFEPNPIQSKNSIDTYQDIKSNDLNEVIDKKKIEILI